MPLLCKMTGGLFILILVICACLSQAGAAFISPRSVRCLLAVVSLTLVVASFRIWFMPPRCRSSCGLHSMFPRRAHSVPICSHNHLLGLLAHASSLCYATSWQTSAAPFERQADSRGCPPLYLARVRWCRRCCQSSRMLYAAPVLRLPVPSATSPPHGRGSWRVA